jgi:hypothetical protein
VAIAYSSQGAGVSSETSGTSLSPACPATVNANNILICHVFWEGTTTAPSTPLGWTLLDGPRVIETTIARHWVFGKLADGTEDGLAVTFAVAPLVTTQRAARIYSFTGWVSGTITDNVPAASFSHQSHATDPAMPTVTTTVAGALAVALVAQNDNNAFASPTGESGGDWVEAVAEYTAALTPGLSLGIETCTPTANPGTVSGGAMATTNDPCGVIGFEIRPSVPAITGSGTPDVQSATASGSGTSGSTGSGTPDAQSSTAAGSGVSSSTGAGAVAVSAASMSGAGTVSDGGVTGAGALAAQSAAAEGDGASASVGTGTIVAQAATEGGAGVSSSTGTGALTAAIAAVVGLGAIAGGLVDCLKNVAGLIRRVRRARRTSRGR